jgi:1-acyl-sn-glycerol-3-phosphate acyltransferase
MNIQPYRTPEVHWPPKMTPWWFKSVDFLRSRALRSQQIHSIELRGLENLKGALDAKQGVLLAPNHSFHWDSYCLLESARQLACPFYIMTAWQVFHESRWFDRISMQRCGCFSVDREGSDLLAMKTAIDILQNRPHPLVVFPEGDVYHTNDRVTPFREGAAAMGLMAARKSQRDIVVIPVALKRWYTEDPSASLAKILDRVEERLYWQPKSSLPLEERILQIADGLLSLKEIEFMHRMQSTGLDVASGDNSFQAAEVVSESIREDSPSRFAGLSARISKLALNILAEVESTVGIGIGKGIIPERVKEVRKRLIEIQGQSQSEIDCGTEMQKMFFVTQLYSYPGDYILRKPSVERIAETVDKFEEDVLGAAYPSVHGTKKVVVQFGAAIQLPQGKGRTMTAGELTERMQIAVQSMLDGLNDQHDSNLPG